MIRADSEKISSNSQRRLKVALVHDFLTEYGGAERVLEALHEIYPKAPVYTAYYDPVSLGVNASKFKNWKIITSWGTKLPFWKQLISPYRIFSKSFFESFDLSDFDLVISSSNAYMAKAVILRRAQDHGVPNGVHICYCHTPPRFLYGYPTALNWRKNVLLRPIGEVINHVMRVWDYEVSQQPDSAHPRGALSSDQAHPGGENSGRVDFFIANSREVQGRIKKFYRRDSEVVYPPVEISRWPLAVSHLKKTNSEKPKAKGDYFLVVSRLVASKNVDVAVEVCAKLGLPLKVAGVGKELEKLKELAKNSANAHPRGVQSSGMAHPGGETGIEFLGEVNDEKLAELYQNCRALIFPASAEDFGLVPVEAMVYGKPVIANAEGGVLETVVDAIPNGKGKCTGVYFDPPTTGSLTLALNNFMDLEKKGYFDPKFIQNHAKKFGKERFKREIEEFVKQKTK